MDYSKSLLGKSLNELQYADIVDFFGELREESTRIEFKSFHPEHGKFKEGIDGVTRAICAMLNSEGGIVIWGAPQEKQSEEHNWKVCQGELSPVKQLKDKDSLISKVSDSITPLPVGVDLQVLSQGEDHVYVFEIQKSNYLPHQFRDLYHVRLDGQTKPAPHYLIDALFKKIRYPNIEGHVRLSYVGYEGFHLKIGLGLGLFNFSGLQNAMGVSFRFLCPGGRFEDRGRFDVGRVRSNDGHEISCDNFAEVLHTGGPVLYNDVLLIRLETLKNDPKFKTKLILSLGATNCPLKVCEYELNFEGVDIHDPETHNNLLIPIELNVLTVDKQNKLGTTREKTLRSFFDLDK